MNIFYLCTLIVLCFIYLCHLLNIRGKLLFFIASYGVNQIDLLYMKIKSLVAICENGYYVKIIIHYTDILNDSFFKHFYCYNQNRHLDISLLRLPKKLKDYLTQQHRLYIKENKIEIEKYDHIGYFENDMDFTLSNLKYYFYTLKLINDNKINNAIPGFKRYEISKCNNGDIKRNCPDFTKNISIRIINKVPFANFSLGYSAMWILPKCVLLKHLNDKEFIYIPAIKNKYTKHGVKEYYSYFYWEKYYTPIIPLSKIDDCFVHHMSNKYVNNKYIIQLTDIYNQIYICKSNDGIKYRGLMKDMEIIIQNNFTKNLCSKLNSC